MVERATATRRTAPVARRGPWLMTGVHLGLVLVAAAVSLGLRGRIPTVLNPSGADGVLYARGAQMLLAGEWLGPYDQFTLAKGPGYPFLFVVAHLVGLELKVAEQVVHLLAAAAIALVLLVTTRLRWVATAAFGIVALTPASFGGAAATTQPDSFFADLGLLAVALAFLTVWGVIRRSRWIWIVSGASAAGFVVAWYHLTRSEAITLLPPMACVIIGVPLVARFLTPRADEPCERPAPRRAALARPSVALAVAAVAMAGPVSIVHDRNHDQYGVAVDTEMAQGTFLRAYADWTRVEAGVPRPLVPVSELQRRAVYAVSPAAAELSSVLEDPANPWRTFACEVGCEFGGGWMVWALRDAAAAAGHFRSPADANAYFGSMSEQIDAACDDGRLSCSARLPASVQPLHQAPAGALARNLAGLTVRLATAEGLYDPPTHPNPLNEDVRALYVAVLHGVPVDAKAAELQQSRYLSRLTAYGVIGSVYRFGLPALFCAAALGTVVGVRRLFRRTSPHPALVVLAVGLVVGVAGRLFLLALIDTTQYDVGPAVRYQLSGHAFLVTWGLIGAALLLPARTHSSAAVH